MEANDKTVGFDISKEFQTTDEAENGKLMPLGDGASITLRSTASKAWRKGWSIKIQSLRVDNKKNRQKALAEAISEILIVDWKNIFIEGKRVETKEDMEKALKRSEPFMDFVWKLANNQDNFLPEEELLD